MSKSQVCPICKLEVMGQTPHCPRCNAVINQHFANASDDPPFPVLDENSGRVEPETLPKSANPAQAAPD